MSLDQQQPNKVDIYTRITLWARRLGQHYVIILVAATLLTASSVWIAEQLKFNSDLADLLPEDHPDLKVLRRIQKRYATDTGFMILLSHNYVFAGDEQGTIHMHNGREWVRSSTKGPIYALWGFGAGDVYAAGATGRVLHFDGQSWTPRPTPTRRSLRGLWGASSAGLLAVGDAGTVLRRQGAGWSQLPSATQRDLRAISGAGEAAWIVGDGGTILRYQQGSLTQEHSPTTQDLLAVSALPGGRVVAVGEAGTLLVRAPSGSWRRLPTKTSGALHAVWSSRWGNTQIMGERGLALHFDGKQVTIQRPASRAKHHPTMLALHGARYDDVWAAGDGCTVERWDWEWFTGPYDSPEHQQRAPCRARLTCIWRPHADLSGAKALVPKLAAALEQSPNISRVDYRKPVQFFWDHALLFSSVKNLQRLRDHIEESLERETAKGTGLYVDLEQDRAAKSKQELRRLYKKYRKMASAFGRSQWFEHPDRASLGIMVYPSKGVSDFANLRRLWREIETIAGRFDLKQFDPLMRLDISGDAVAKITEYDATVKDVFGNVWIAVLGIVVLMLVYFRRLLGLIFVGLPLGMSIAWTFALTTIFIGTLNAVTGFLFAVLFGLGIDYGLQLFARYREGRAAGLSVDDAMNHVVLDTGRATLTSALTTAAALLTLTVTDFKGFSEFGFIAGIGVLLALVSFILVMPAMILLAERLRLLRFREQRTTTKDERQAPGQEPFRMPRVVLLLSVVLTAFGVYGATQIRFEYNNRKLRPVLPKDEVQRRAGRTLGRPFTPTLLVADSRDELEAAVDAIDRERKRLGKKSAVNSVASILSLVPGRQHEKRVILQELDDLLHDKRWNLVSDKTKKKLQLKHLRQLVKAKPFTLEQLPKEARRSFKGPGYGSIWLAMVFHSIDLGHTKQARLLKDQVGNFHGSAFVNLGRLTAPGSTVIAEGRRAEIRCAAPRQPCVQQTIGRLRQLRREGQPVFAHVLTKREAYRKKLAVVGGLHGDILAIAKPGVILRKERGTAPIQPSGVFNVSSGELVLAEVVEVLLHDGRIAFGLALCAIFIAALLDFRSLRAALLACLPLGVGLLLTFGVMAVIKLKLNLFNFVILPALLGIGIDYGVHYVHRYQSEGFGNLGRVMRALYWVIFFCAATTIVGFGNMALAEHPGLRSLGELAIIGLFCMFFASTYTLPAVLYAVERLRGAPAPSSADARPAIVVYATTYCPSCRLVRRLLADQGVRFSFVELDTLPAAERRRLAAEIVKATGADALPVTRVDQTYVVGFDRDALCRALRAHSEGQAA